MLKNYAVCYIVLQESILCLYGGYLQVSRGPFLNKRNTEQDLDNDYGLSVVSLFYYCPMLQLLQGIYIVSAGYPECVGCLWVFSQCISDRSVKPKKWHLLSAVFSQELHYKIFGEGSKVVWAVSGSVWRVSWGWVVESILTLSEGGGMVSAGCLDYVWMVSGSVFWVTICVLSSLGHNQAKKNAFILCRIFPQASFQNFLRGFEGCLDCVWKCLEGISGLSSWINSTTGYTNDKEAVI